MTGALMLVARCDEVQTLGDYGVGALCQRDRGRYIGR